MKRYDAQDDLATLPTRAAALPQRVRAGRPAVPGPAGRAGQAAAAAAQAGRRGDNVQAGQPVMAASMSSMTDAEPIRAAQPDVKRRSAHAPDSRPGFLLPSPLGDVVLRGDDRHLSGLWFAGQKHFPTQLAVLPSEQEGGRLPDAVRQGHEEIVAYFTGKLKAFSVPLTLSGTPFQQQVWAMLLDIPFGKQVSYGSLAQAAGLPPGGSRAIGNAVGRNPISIIVPCHRVIGASGTLTGYAGGLERKQHLLTLEGGVAGHRGLFD